MNQNPQPLMSVTITMHEDASVSIESKAAAGYSLKVNKNKAAIQQGVLLIIEAGLEVMREQFRLPLRTTKKAKSKETQPANRTVIKRIRS